MKAILIIDLPKMCADCPMFTWADITDIECEEGFCTHTHKLVHYNERPLDCPLKPMPKKKNTDFHPNIVYANGWNDCLKEITE